MITMFGKLVLGGYIAFVSIISYFISSLLEITKSIVYFFRVSLVVIFLLFFWSSGILHLTYYSFVDVNEISAEKQKELEELLKKSPIPFEYFMDGVANEFWISQTLTNSIRDLLEQKLVPTTPQQDIYVTNLTFIDTDTKNIMLQTEEAKLINEAVLDGIKRAQKVNPGIKLNASGHALQNTDANVGQLTTIIHDRNKTPEERVNTIISEMMAPNQLDVIVTGQYTDRGAPEPIILRPFLFITKEKTFVTKSLKFDRQQYICSSPNEKTQKALCASVYEEIAKAVKELLETL